LINKYLRFRIIGVNDQAKLILISFIIRNFSILTTLK